MQSRVLPESTSDALIYGPLDRLPAPAGTVAIHMPPTVDTLMSAACVDESVRPAATETSVYAPSSLSANVTMLAAEPSTLRESCGVTDAATMAASAADLFNDTVVALAWYT